FLLAALYALGPATPLHRLAYTLLPGFRWVRTPARIFLAGGLALSVLSGFAVERLTRDRWSATAARHLSRAALFAGLLALLTGGGLALIAPAVRPPALALAVFIPAGLAAALARVRQKISPRHTVLALALLTAADLGRFDASLMRFVPPDAAMSPGQAEAQYLARQSGLFRVYSPSYSLPVQTAAAAGLHLADGVEPVHLAVYDRFMARAGGYGDASFSVTIPNFGDQPPETALRGVRPDPRLLGLLNVQYLVSAFPLDAPGLSLVHRTDTAYIYRNRAARPRAWVAYRSEPAGENWLDRLAGPPAEGQTVLVEQGPLLDPPAAGLPSTAQVVDYRANRLTIDVQTAAPGWLVVSEIWYPGWQATVNHAQQPVERVNGLLRGVYLPQAGRYRVEMVYRPWSVRLGGWISGLTAAVYFILAAASIKSWMRGSISAGLG
ncbi:MAG: hypothetical protein D6784_03240, partial [Chloroflexi bacterium]